MLDQAITDICSVVDTSVSIGPHAKLHSYLGEQPDRSTARRSLLLVDFRPRLDHRHNTAAAATLATPSPACVENSLAESGVVLLPSDSMAYWL